MPLHYSNKKINNKKNNVPGTTKVILPGSRPLAGSLYKNKGVEELLSSTNTDADLDHERVDTDVNKADTVTPTAQTQESK
jgi:hypothetical protein